MLKYGLWAFVFLLPFHAILVTALKCWYELPENVMNVLRFWKEWVIIALLVWVLVNIYKKYKFNFWRFLENNTYAWVLLSFILCSFVYVFFPFFEPWLVHFLGFKYDVFFLFALIAGSYLLVIRQNLDFLMKTLFVSIWTILWIFLPFFVFSDVSLLAEIFGYSKEVSTYQANSCIAFAQNVDWHHRFQATFGWPIRFSVFITTFLMLYLWYALSYLVSIRADKLKYALYIWLPFAFYLPSLYFSYTKTSILGFLFWMSVFTLLYLKKNWIKISKRYFVGAGAFVLFAGSVFVYIKRDMFLHLWSVLDRLNSFERSIEMFFLNPFWYWLWIAGPASIVEDRFWPENWFIQILLEQSIIGLALFVSIIIMLWNCLYKIFLRKRDFTSMWFLTAFLTLVFMSNFTHAFEESATSYILFMLIGAYIMNNLKLKDIK